MGKTALILGAGASYPYQFPTSRELNEIIIGSNAGALTTIRERLGHEIEWLDAARTLSDSNYYHPSFDDFREAFAQSASHSIDLFVQARAREYEQYQAQIAVAAIFLCCETEAILQVDDWYRQLWNEVLRHGGRNFPSGKLSVITFNYERSLEHYLAHKAKAAFGLCLENAHQWLSRIPIGHVYGQLGSLSMSPLPDYIPFGNMHGDNVWKAAGKLRLAGPRADGAECAWTERLRDADRIFFLGFGFWPENLSLLREFIPDSASIFASALGFSEKDKKRVSKELPSIHWGEPQWTVLQCLNTWDLF